MQKVIKAMGLVDVEKGTVIPNPFVMIDESKITAIGALAEMPTLETQTMVLDLSEKYVLPGLINSHAHLCLPADGKPPDAYYRESNEIWLLTAAKNARIVDARPLPSRKRLPFLRTRRRLFLHPHGGYARWRGGPKWPN